MSCSDDLPTDPPAANGKPSADDLAPLPPGIVEPVVVDAAGLIGLTVDEVVVLSCVEVTWPDGSLGCPQPGMVYPQVLVDGYRVVVRAAGQDFDYRVRGPGSFRRCVPRTKDVVTPIP